MMRDPRRGYMWTLFLDILKCWARRNLLCYRPYKLSPSFFPTEGPSDEVRLFPEVETAAKSKQKKYSSIYRFKLIAFKSTCEFKSTDR